MRKSKAFTLVELLVVIAVIALLMAILLPALNKAKEQGKRVVCASNMKTLMTANFNYAGAYEGYFVPVDYYYPDPMDADGDGLTTEFVSWKENKAYIRMVGIDSMKHKKIDADNDGEDDYNPFKLPDDFVCPSDLVSKDYSKDTAGLNNSSYSYNSTGLVCKYGWPGDKNFYVRPPICGLLSQQIKRSSEKLTFIDGIDWYTIWGDDTDYTKGWDQLGQSGLNDYRTKLSPPVYSPVIYRHNQGANVAFYDGHVTYMKKQEIWLPADWTATPKKPGMWVADMAFWNKSQSSLCP